MFVFIPSFLAKDTIATGENFRPPFRGQSVDDIELGFLVKPCTSYNIKLIFISRRMAQIGRVVDVRMDSLASVTNLRLPSISRLVFYATLILIYL